MVPHAVPWLILTIPCAQVHLDLYLPARKRVVKTIDLYGPIDPEKSVYKILGTKVRSIVLPVETARIAYGRTLSHR